MCLSFSIWSRNTKVKKNHTSHRPRNRKIFLHHPELKWIQIVIITTRLLQNTTINQRAKYCNQNNKLINATSSRFFFKCKNDKVTPDFISNISTIKRDLSRDNGRYTINDKEGNTKDSLMSLSTKQPSYVSMKGR